MFGFPESSSQNDRPPVSPPEDLFPRSRIIDVPGMIRQASTRVSVDQLVRKGKKYINLLSHEMIDELINRAVRTIVDKHRLGAARGRGADAAQLEAESTAEFETLLRQYQQTAAATSAVEASKLALEVELRQPSPDPAPAAVPEPGDFEDFVRELDRQAIRMFRIRKQLLGRLESPEAVAELGQVQEILRAIVSKIVRAERGRFTAPAADAREVATLQKRIEKLTAHIATMEAALGTLSKAKTFSNQQVQNLLRDLGLAQEDKNFEKKREMLRVVLDANRGIRMKARELASLGITLDAPEERAHFTPAVDPVSDLFSRSSV